MITSAEKKSKKEKKASDGVNESSLNMAYIYEIEEKLGNVSTTFSLFLFFLRYFKGRMK